MQIKGTKFYGRRTLYYWAKMFGSQLDAVVKEEDSDKYIKQGYSELRKCIVISLMDFTFFDDKRYHRCFALKDKETNEMHKDLDYLDLYFVELDKFYEKMDNVKSTLDRWISFLNNAHNYSQSNLPNKLSEVKEIQKATEKLKVMTLNNLERQYYESQQKFLLDEITRMNYMEEMKEKLKAAEEGIKAAEENAKAAQEDAKNRTIEIAKKLKETGMPISAISEITGLSIKEIEKL